MIRPNLLTWQRDLYPDNHTTRLNLAIHLVTVPMFHMGLLTLVLAIVSLSAFTLLSAFIVLSTTVVLQGVGHKREPKPPVPSGGLVDMVSRVIVEQLVTFPRFVLSGQFIRGWLASGR